MGEGLERVLARRSRGREGGREGRGGGPAGRQDPSPSEGRERQELSAVLLQAGLRDQVPREGSGKGGLLRLLLG